MNSLDKQHFIKMEKLNPEYYFQSILQEAYSLKLINDSELENIQLQCLHLTAKETDCYTSGESSSVRIEIAQSITQSICYCIGIYLKSLTDADTALELLKHKPLASLYEQGRELLKLKLEASKQLLLSIQRDYLSTDNIAYNDTIQNSISSFFSDYDADFAAQETPASIDYPISCDKMDLVGIEYIHCYLQKLYLENEFCKNFTEQDIHSLLRGYDKNYKELLINIFGLVVTNLAGLALCGKNTLKFNIKNSHRQYLQHKLEKLSKEDLDILLLAVSENICNEFSVSDKMLQEHIKVTVKELSPRLKNALENRRLESLFISIKGNYSEPTYKFEEGANLDDGLFRKIIEEIRECRYVSDKIAIIKKEVHSITDLVDIFEAYCVFDNEFYDIFNSLEDLELALLCKRLPGIGENEKEWHKSMNAFLENIELTRRKRIMMVSEKISF